MFSTSPRVVASPATLGARRGPARTSLGLGARTAGPVRPTLVTHTYDWTELRDRSRIPRAQATTAANLLASLDRLAAVAEEPDRQQG